MNGYTHSFIWELEQDADMSWADEATMEDYRNGTMEILCLRLVDADGHTVDCLGNIACYVDGSRAYMRDTMRSMAEDNGIDYADCDTGSI